MRCGTNRHTHTIHFTSVTPHTKCNKNTLLKLHNKIVQESPIIPQLLLFPFHGHFPGEPGSARSLSRLLLHLFQNKNFWGSMEQVFMGQKSFMSPTISVKELKGTQSTNPNQ